MLWRCPGRLSCRWMLYTHCTSWDAAEHSPPVHPACPAAQWFARLWEIEPHDFWGYITNCGTGAPPVCMCGQACKCGLPLDAALGQQRR